MFKIGDNEPSLGDWDLPGRQITTEVTDGSGIWKCAIATDTDGTDPFFWKWTLKLGGQRFDYRSAKLQVGICILSITACASAAACSGSECTPPEGWDNFANNLGSDLAPLLALFGEQVTKQYMSESLGWVDSLLFALAPLGIITAIVGAIRVAGKPTFRSLIGRARESRGEVEADLMSSTSPDVCELWNGEGVVRVLGSPVLLQLIHGENIEDDSPESDNNAGIFTFREAIRRGFYRKEGAEGNPIVTSAEIRGTEMADYSDIEQLQNRENPPNLSLNVSMKPLNPSILIGFVIFGILLQGGVIAFAAIAQYKLELWKNDQPPVGYGFPLFALGTLTLAVGMFLCAHTVETSTHEETWVPSGGARSVIWLQQGGQTVGDQRFEAFARITPWSEEKPSENHVLTSNQAAKTLRTSRSSLVTIAMSTTLVGFILQFAGLRVMHSSVTVVQLTAVLIMTALRSCAHIQRNARNDINGSDLTEGQDPNEVENHQVEQVEGHELDWLARQLGQCQSWEIISPDDTLRSLMYNISSDTLDLAMRVTKIRARLATLSSGWNLEYRSKVKVLQTAIETTMNQVFSLMTLADDLAQESKYSWAIPVNARFKNGDMTTSPLNLFLTRDKDENGNWSDWTTDETMIEAVLCLSISSLTEIDRKRARAGLARLVPVRLLGLSTPDTRVTHQWWANRGAAVTESALNRQADRYFGWTADSGRTWSTPESTLYLSTRAEGELDILCAQHIYSAFIFQLARGIKKLGGKTTVRMVDLKTANQRGQFGLNNSSLVSIAECYQESGLGTIEEAYCTLVPAFGATVTLSDTIKSMAIPSTAYYTARKEARRLANDGLWDRAAEIESWLCSDSDNVEVPALQVILTREQMARRVLTMSQKIVAEARKGESNDQLRELWHTTYAHCQLVSVIEHRATCLLNLATTWEKIYPTTADTEVFQLAFDAVETLDITKRELREIRDKFVRFAIQKEMFTQAESVATPLWAAAIENPGSDVYQLQNHHFDQMVDIRQRGAQFPVNDDQLSQYLLSPELQRHAAETDSRTAPSHAENDVPIDIHLLLRYRTPLQIAVTCGHEFVVRKLLGSGDVSEEPATNGGRTALQEAAGRGHIEVVEFLLSVDAAVNEEPAGTGGRTALQAAAQGGHMAIVQRLLTAGADINAQPAKSDGRTALQAAAARGDIDMVVLLLDKKADMNAKPSAQNGRTALQAAAEGGHTKAAEILIAAGADINAEPADINGRTALQAAAAHGDIEIVKLLLDTGANVNATPSRLDGQTQLQAAAGGGHTKIVELLLNTNESDYRDRAKAIHEAASNGHAASVELLIASGADVNVLYDQQSALSAAAEGGHVAVVDILLAANTDTSYSWSINGCPTALYSAAANGHTTVVEQLLTAGVDVHAVNNYSPETALYAAASAGHPAIVKLLLSAGANINFSYHGRTIMGAAAQNGHAEVVELLRAASSAPTAKT